MFINNNNPFRRNTSLDQIIQDGWMRGLHPEQTIQEASAAGYSMVIVRPMIDREWMRMNDEYEAFFANL